MFPPRTLSLPGTGVGVEAKVEIDRTEVGRGLGYAQGAAGRRRRGSALRSSAQWRASLNAGVAQSPRGGDEMDPRRELAGREGTALPGPPRLHHVLPTRFRSLRKPRLPLPQTPSPPPCGPGW